MTETLPEPDANPQPSNEPKAIAGLVKGALGLLVLASGVLFALPWVLSQTAVGDYAAELVAARLPEGTTVGRPVLSWFSGVGVTDVVYRDETTTIGVKEARASEPFWRLLFERDRVPALTFEDVTIEHRLADADDEGPLGDSDDPKEAKHEDLLQSLAAITLKRVAIRLTGAPLRQPVDLHFRTVEISAADSPATPTATTPPSQRGASQRTVRWEGDARTGDSVAPMSGSFTGDLSEVTGTGELRFDALDLAATLAAVVDPSAFSIASTGTFGVEATREPGRSWVVRAGYQSLSAAVMTPSLANPVELADVKVVSRLKVADDARLLQLDAVTLTSATATAAGSGLWILDEQAALAATPDTMEPPRSRIDANVRVAGSLVSRHGLPPAVAISDALIESIVLEPRPNDGAIVARGEVAWPLAEAYGVISQDGRAEWTYTPEAAAITLSQVPIGTGRALGRYEVRFGETPQLAFEGGPVLQRVTLTEPLCRDWLRYVSPAIANATEVRGEFSLALSPFEMPLSGRPQQATGRLDVHSARLKPGPVVESVLQRGGGLAQLVGRDNLAQRVAGLIGRELVTLPSQSVNFAVDPAGVAHDRFEMRSGDVRVTTAGRVNFDEQIALTLSVVPPQVAGGDRDFVQAALSQPIDVQLTGTIKQPRVARGGLRSTGRNAVRGAAGSLLRGLLDRRDD